MCIVGGLWKRASLQHVTAEVTAAQTSGLVTDFAFLPQTGFSKSDYPFID